MKLFGPIYERTLRWARHRNATWKFVQDIPLSPSDPGFHMVLDTAARLQRLSTKPILILWGGKDFVFDVDYYYEWRRRFPHAKYRFFDAAGHYVVEDQGVEILGEIRRFLKNDSVR